MIQKIFFIQTNLIIYLFILILISLYGSASYGEGVNNNISKFSLTNEQNKKLTSDSQQPKFIIGEDGTGKCELFSASNLTQQFDLSSPQNPYWTKPKELVQVGLRNLAGKKDEHYQVTARIITPDGDVVSAYTNLKNDEFTYLIYPDDFNKSEEAKIGTYTVIWEVNGKAVACHGFLVVESDNGSANLATFNQLETRLTEITDIVLGQAEESTVEKFVFNKGEQARGGSINNFLVSNSFINNYQSLTNAFVADLGQNSTISFNSEQLLFSNPNQVNISFFDSSNFISSREFGKDIKKLPFTDESLTNKSFVELNDPKITFNPPYTDFNLPLEPLLIPDINPILVAPKINIFNINYSITMNANTNFNFPFSTVSTVPILRSNQTNSALNIPEPNFTFALFIFTVIGWISLRKTDL